MNAPHKRVLNTNTGEVYAAAGPREWLERLTEWRAAMRDCGYDVRTCRVASPMPEGHIVFLRSAKRRPAHVRPLD